MQFAARPVYLRHQITERVTTLCVHIPTYCWANRSRGQASLGTFSAFQYHLLQLAATDSPDLRLKTYFFGLIKHCWTIIRPAANICAATTVWLYRNFIIIIIVSVVVKHLSLASGWRTRKEMHKSNNLTANNTRYWHTMNCSGVCGFLHRCPHASSSRNASCQILSFWTQHNTIIRSYHNTARSTTETYLVSEDVRDHDKHLRAIWKTTVPRGQLRKPDQQQQCTEHNCR